MIAGTARPTLRCSTDTTTGSAPQRGRDHSNAVNSAGTGSSKRNVTSLWCLTTASLPIQFNVGMCVPVLLSFLRHLPSDRASLLPLLGDRINSNSSTPGDCFRRETGLCYRQVGPVAQLHAGAATVDVKLQVPSLAPGRLPTQHKPVHDVIPHVAGFFVRSRPCASRRPLRAPTPIPAVSPARTWLQPIEAPRGSRSRRFKSFRPDHLSKPFLACDAKAMALVPAVHLQRGDSSARRVGTQCNRASIP
jgi:hypothetical protein